MHIIYWQRSYTTFGSVWKDTVKFLFLQFLLFHLEIIYGVI